MYMTDVLKILKFMGWGPSSMYALHENFPQRKVGSYLLNSSLAEGNLSFENMENGRMWMIRRSFENMSFISSSPFEWIGPRIGPRYAPPLDHDMPVHSTCVDDRSFLERGISEMRTTRLPPCSTTAASKHGVVRSSRAWVYWDSAARGDDGQKIRFGENNRWG